MKMEGEENTIDDESNTDWDIFATYSRIYSFPVEFLSKERLDVAFQMFLVLS